MLSKNQFPRVFSILVSLSLVMPAVSFGDFRPPLFREEFNTATPFGLEAAENEQARGQSGDTGAPLPTGPVREQPDKPNVKGVAPANQPPTPTSVKGGQPREITAGKITFASPQEKADFNLLKALAAKANIPGGLSYKNATRNGDTITFHSPNQGPGHTDGKNTVSINAKLGTIEFHENTSPKITAWVFNDSGGIETRGAKINLVEGQTLVMKVPPGARNGEGAVVSIQSAQGSVLDSKNITKVAGVENKDAIAGTANLTQISMKVVGMSPQTGGPLIQIAMANAPVAPAPVGVIAAQAQAAPNPAKNPVLGGIDLGERTGGPPPPSNVPWEHIAF